MAARVPLCRDCTWRLRLARPAVKIAQALHALAVGAARRVSSDEDSHSGS